MPYVATMPRSRRPLTLRPHPAALPATGRVPDAVRHRQRRRHDAGGGSAARRAGRDVCAARLAAAGAAPGRGRQPRAGATPALARNADARAARVAVTAAGLALCDARSGGARPAGGQHDGRRARPFAQPESERVGAGHGAGVACAAARSAGRHGPGTWVDAAGAGAHAQHVHEPSGQHRRGAVGGEPRTRVWSPLWQALRLRPPACRARTRVRAMHASK
eukprot:365162-Chlamydomonas_euryale.AAC.3